MKNIIGKQILIEADKYIELKGKYTDYNEYFTDFITENFTVDEKDIIVINEYVKECIDTLEVENDEIILKQLNELKEKFVTKNYCDKDLNILEFMSLMLLGNIINSKNINSEDSKDEVNS